MLNNLKYINKSDLIDFVKIFYKNKNIKLTKTYTNDLELLNKNELYLLIKKLCKVASNDESYLLHMILSDKT